MKSAIVRWSELLQGIPSTGHQDNVIQMDPHRHEPPPVVNTLYTEIMKDRDAIANLEHHKARIEADLLQATQQARVVIANVEAEIAEMRSGIAEKQGRWIIITRDLGINIED